MTEKEEFQRALAMQQLGNDLNAAMMAAQQRGYLSGGFSFQGPCNCCDNYGPHMGHYVGCPCRRER